MPGYLAYHPRRVAVQVAGITVHDNPARRNSQDPYLWSRRFLHSYCHLSRMSPQVGDVIFWVNGDTFPAFNALFCDLVFVVQERCVWAQPDRIAPDDPLVEHADAFAAHYRWAHQYPTRRPRATLKADPELSFQPQDGSGHLLDIVPLLYELGYTLDELRYGLRSGYQSRPMPLDTRAHTLRDLLAARAPVRLTGPQLAALRDQP